MGPKMEGIPKSAMMSETDINKIMTHSEKNSDRLKKPECLMCNRYTQVRKVLRWS
jgi:hypothetical protein